MALATPVPHEGIDTKGKDFLAGSTLPEAEAILVVPVVEAFLRRHPGADTSMIVRAAESATTAHAGQLRRSGEPYITHPIAVAGIVADLGLDAQTVAAALLHDAVEDTGVTADMIEGNFGSAVAAIVDGVTKLDRLQFDSKEAQQAATVRKMLVAMANDWRVLIIKLADRLHNMRTLSAMPEWKQRRTAQETMDIYAPLAHRLGIQEVKWQLEDLAFATLHPKRYAEIEQMVASRAPSRNEYLARVLVAVRERIAASGVTAEVTGRPKHLWSIYEKMVVRGKEFDDINDLVAIRVVVTSEKDCWAALGAIHAIWAPVQGTLQGLHQLTQVQPLPVPAHHGDRARWQAHRGTGPHPRDAPPGRVRHRRSLGVQGERHPGGRIGRTVQQREAQQDSQNRQSRSRQGREVRWARWDRGRQAGAGVQEPERCQSQRGRSPGIGHY